MGYYCLIASLEQLSLDNSAGSIDFAKIYGEIIEDLTPQDKQYAQMLYSYYDIVNLLGQMSGRDVPHNGLGQLSSENIDALIKGEELPEDTINPLPVEVQNTLEIVLGREEPTEQIDIDPNAASQGEKEMLLLDNFYKSCQNSTCKFLKAWGQADRGIRGVCAKVEDEELLDVARDSEWYKELMEVLKVEDFVVREHAMDKLRWGLVEGFIEAGGISDTAHQADINTVLCYMVQLNIIQRWAQLSKELGQERFQAMVDSFIEKGKL